MTVDMIKRNSGNAEAGIRGIAVQFTATAVDRTLDRDKAEADRRLGRDKQPCGFGDLHFGVSDRHRFYPTARPDPRKGLQHVCGVPGMLFL